MAVYTEKRRFFILPQYNCSTEFDDIADLLFYSMAIISYRLLVVGCSLSILGATLLSTPAWTTEFSSVFSLLAQTPTPETKGQMLPITAIAQIGSEQIQLEVAQTPRQQAMGLMFRTSLPSNRGMLFPFARPRVVGFWMKNCKISLDMIFLRNGIVQGIQAEAPPCVTEPCPSYGINVPIDQVIELRGGRAQELGVKVGDRVSVEALPK
ncbi:MAG: DUF192 domain-containing protein [Microcoleaceae cyanobacterium]